jgi:hypothetical protein
MSHALTTVLREGRRPSAIRISEFPLPALNSPFRPKLVVSHTSGEVLHIEHIVWYYLHGGDGRCRSFTCM